MGLGTAQKLQDGEFFFLAVVGFCLSVGEENGLWYNVLRLSQ